MYGVQNKWCFVPLCTSTTVSTPDKLFVSVPQKYSRKSKWFQAARRDMPKSKTVFHCCEDHFNLEEDMENYMRYRFMGGNIYLKTGVHPHIFACQTGSKRAGRYPNRHARKQLIEEVIAGSDVKQEILEPIISIDEPSTSTECVLQSDISEETCAVSDSDTPGSVFNALDFALKTEEEEQSQTSYDAPLSIEEEPKIYTRVPDHWFAHDIDLFR